MILKVLLINGKFILIPATSIRYIEEGIVNPNEKEILVSKIHFSTNMIAITLETVDSLNHRWIAALNNKPIPFEAANLYMLS